MSTAIKSSDIYFYINVVLTVFKSEIERLFLMLKLYVQKKISNLQIRIHTVCYGAFLQMGEVVWTVSFLHQCQTPCPPHPLSTRV